MKGTPRRYKPLDFQKLNFNEPIVLTNLPREQKSVRSAGSSSLEFATSWFRLPDGRRAFFKTYWQDKPNMVNDYLISKLFEKISVKSAEYKPATIFVDPEKESPDSHVHTFGDVMGLITIDFLKKGEKLVPLFSLVDSTYSDDYDEDIEQYQASLQDAMNALDDYVERGLIEDKNAKESVYKIVLVDTLTLQNDRSTQTNFDIIKKEDGTYRLAPVFDHESAFNLGVYMTDPRANEEIEFSAEDSIKQFHPSSNFDICIKDKKDTRSLLKRLNSFASMACDDEDIMQWTQEVLSVDLSELYEEIERDGVIPSPEYKAYTIELFNTMKASLEKEIKNEQASRKAK